MIRVDDYFCHVNCTREDVLIRLYWSCEKPSARPRFPPPIDFCPSSWGKYGWLFTRLKASISCECTKMAGASAREVGLRFRVRPQNTGCICWSRPSACLLLGLRCWHKEPLSKDCVFSAWSLRACFASLEGGCWWGTKVPLLCVPSG